MEQLLQARFMQARVCETCFLNFRVTAEKRRDLTETSSSGAGLCGAAFAGPLHAGARHAISQAKGINNSMIGSQR